MKKLQRIEYQMTQANRKRHIVRDIGNTPGINQHAISLTEASTLLSGAYQTSVDVYPWAHNRVTMLAYKPTGGGGLKQVLASNWNDSLGQLVGIVAVPQGLIPGDKFLDGQSKAIIRALEWHAHSPYADSQFVPAGSYIRNETAKALSTTQFPRDSSMTLSDFYFPDGPDRHTPNWLPVYSVDNQTYEVHTNDITIKDNGTYYGRFHRNYIYPDPLSPETNQFPNTSGVVVSCYTKVWSTSFGFEWNTGFDKSNNVVSSEIGLGLIVTKTFVNYNSDLFILPKKAWDYKAYEGDDLQWHLPTFGDVIVMDQMEDLFNYYTGAENYGYYQALADKGYMETEGSSTIDDDFFNSVPAVAGGLAVAIYGGDDYANKHTFHSYHFLDNFPWNPITYYDFGENGIMPPLSS